MTRRLTKQYATFWFAIDERLPEDESTSEEFYNLWKQASTLIATRQQAHPLRVFQVQEGSDNYEIERWEFCEPEAYLKNQDGRLAWPVVFYSTKAFELPSLLALRDLCLQAMVDAAQGVSVRFVKATAYSTYTGTETTTYAGLA